MQDYISDTVRLAKDYVNGIGSALDALREAPNLLNAQQFLAIKTMSAQAKSKM